MPCCLFTWHAYGSWYPDHPKGFVHWERGYSPSNVALAEQYRQLQTEESAELGLEHQQILVEEVVKSGSPQRFRLHAMACEASHLHLLISWRHRRKSEMYRRSIRHSMTQRLNR